VRAWNLLDVDAPDGTRDPVVLHSTDEARAVLVVLNPGQRLGDHQVFEHAYLAVVDGNVRVHVGSDTYDAGAGMLFRFDAGERHAVASESGARILLFLAPWPGEGHYRGGDGQG
jgi:quercetin dioxygenase-like cupin family protein